MSEKQNNWGVTVLVSEIKRVGNSVFLEVLVMEGEIGFFLLQGLKGVTWTTLDNAYLFISSQIGPFSTFLLVISFLQVKLASLKDN